MNGLIVITFVSITFIIIAQLTFLYFPDNKKATLKVAFLLFYLITNAALALAIA